MPIDVLLQRPRELNDYSWGKRSREVRTAGPNSPLARVRGSLTFSKKGFVAEDTVDNLCILSDVQHAGDSVCIEPLDRLPSPTRTPQRHSLSEMSVRDRKPGRWILTVYELDLHYLAIARKELSGPRLDSSTDYMR